MNIELVQQITKNTLIPLSLVISIIGVVSFINNIWFETKANGENIREVQQQIKQQLIDTQNRRDQYNVNLRLIFEKLSRIEGKLDIR